jgi:hypothetical protein
MCSASTEKESNCDVNSVFSCPSVARTSGVKFAEHDPHWQHGHICFSLLWQANANVVGRLTHV